MAIWQFWTLIGVLVAILIAIIRVAAIIDHGNDLLNAVLISLNGVLSRLLTTFTPAPSDVDRVRSQLEEIDANISVTLLEEIKGFRADIDDHFDRRLPKEREALVERLVSAMYQHQQNIVAAIHGGSQGTQGG